MSTLTLRQKWHVRNASQHDYLCFVRQDGRRAAYKRLHLVKDPGQRRALVWFKSWTSLANLGEGGLRQMAKQQQFVLADMPTFVSDPSKVFHNYLKALPCRKPWRLRLGTLQSRFRAAGIPEEESVQYHDPARMQMITGSATTSFIAETFGIQRGQLPSTRALLVLSAQYNVMLSSHRPLYSPLQIRDEFSFIRYVNRLYLAPSWASVYAMDTV